MTRQDRPAPGVVHVRLTGVPADAEALAAVLAGTPGVQILTGPDGPLPQPAPARAPALPHRAAHPAAHHQRPHRPDGRKPR